MSNLIIHYLIGMITFYPYKNKDYKNISNGQNVLIQIHKTQFVRSNNNPLHHIERRI